MSSKPSTSTGDAQADNGGTIATLFNLLNNPEFQAFAQRYQSQTSSQPTTQTTAQATSDKSDKSPVKTDQTKPKPLTIQFGEGKVKLIDHIISPTGQVLYVGEGDRLLAPATYVRRQRPQGNQQQLFPVANVRSAAAEIGIDYKGKPVKGNISKDLISSTAR